MMETWLYIWNEHDEMFEDLNVTQDEVHKWFQEEHYEYMELTPEKKILWDVEIKVIWKDIYNTTHIIYRTKGTDDGMEDNPF